MLRNASRMLHCSHQHKIVYKARYSELMKCREVGGEAELYDRIAHQNGYSIGVFHSCPWQIITFTVPGIQRKEYRERCKDPGMPVSCFFQSPI